MLSKDGYYCNDRVSVLEFSRSGRSRSGRRLSDVGFVNDGKTGPDLEH